MTRDELDKQAAPLMQSDVESLAPGMQGRVNDFLEECETKGLNVALNETARSNALQVLYYSFGRDVNGKKIGETITNAKDASRSWHGYKLAVDLKHKTKGYNIAPQWWSEVAAIAAKHGLDWGGHWATKDIPHFQFAGTPAAPTVQDRDDHAHNNLGAVWKRYGINE